LRPGEVFYLRKPDSVRVMIGDIPVFEAQVGRTGAAKAVRVERSISPPKN
jgi:flagellar motor switch protein FliM